MKLKKTVIVLGFILLVALGFRFIAAMNLGIGPDEMVYSVYPYKFSTSGKLSTVEQAPVYFLLKDFGYRMFGYGLLPSRLPSIIFGSLIAIVIFLIGREVESKRTGFFAAFFFAISTYAVKSNLEMDPTMYFFGFLSVLFYIQWVKGKAWAVVPSAMALVLGMLAKPIVGLLLIPYGIFYAYWVVQGKSDIIKKEKGRYLLQVQNLKWVGIAFLISVLMVSPVLVYNYIYYQELGKTDYYFTQMLGIGENVYKGMGGQKPWSWARFTSTSQGILQRFSSDFLLIVLALFGAVLAVKKRKEWFGFFGLCILGIWVYLAGRTGSPTHYIGVIGFLSIFSAIGLFYLLEILQKRKFMPYVVAGIFFVHVFLLIPTFTQTTEVPQLMEIIKDIPSEALVITEPRIYHGIAAYAFADKHFIQFQNFAQLQQANLTGNDITVPVYFIECSEGTCLWSTEDYARVLDMSRRIVGQFTQQTRLVGEVHGEQYSMKVHTGYITTKEGIYPAGDSLKRFFLASIGWEKPSVDSFDVKGGFNNFLYGIGMIMLYLNALFALAAIWWVYLLVQDD